MFYARQTFRVPFLIVAMLVAAAAAAARPAPLPERPVGDPGLIRGGVPGAAKAAGDTILLMGPYGSGAPYIGDFEDGRGGGAWHGWTDRDFTYDPSSHWHAATYNAVSGAYSAWCGEMIPSCGAGDPDGGYGNNWNDILEWRGTVADPGQPCQVDVGALANYDVEPGYDYCYLTVVTAGGDLDLWVRDGTATAVAVAGSHTYHPGDYVGDGADEVVVRFRFESDGGWSDGDCAWPTAGAIQLDDVAIALSNGAGAGHDFEDGTLGPLAPVVAPGVGSFAQLMNNLQDLDICVDNLSWQVVFIDDGLVVPGTGGSYCINWCYGPGGFIVNTTGGLAGPEEHLHCAVLSPAMTWPDQACDGGRYEFTAYGQEDLSADAPGIFVNWSVRSTDSGNPADLEDARWEDRGFLYDIFGYTRMGGIVSDLLVPGRTHVQVKFEVMELGWIWGWNGDDGYPAPYFDHARFTVFPQDGPDMVTREIDLAQDAFPASGALDAVDLGANSVRFDMARNISLATHLRLDPGDSLIVGVDLVRAGSVLVARPRLHWRLRANPVFDAVRTSGLTAAGWVYCDTVRTASGGVVENRWAADLPDTGFLFPGDVLHYYFTATDAVGGDLRTAILPADTTGFADFDDPLGYDPGFTLRALPAVLSAAGGAFDQPRVLFWNDMGNRGGRDEWHGALAWNNLRPGLEYDTYYTNGAISGVGNGLGSRATAAQLVGYEDLVYTSGDLSFHTICNGDFAADPSPDVQVLEAWFTQGGKDAFLTGDELAYELHASGPETAAFLQDRVGVAVVSSDLRYLIGGQVAPRVLALPGNPVFGDGDSWIAAGGCPGLNTFDAVTVIGSGVRLAEFGDPAGLPGAYPYSAATFCQNGTGRVVSLPYDLMYVENDPAQPTFIPARNLVLRAAGIALDFIQVPFAVPGIPETGVFAARHWPNPFNPAVTIACAVPRPGRLTVKVFDVRGRLVRTVWDEVVEQSVDLAWDGRDDTGARMASGVYFYEARMQGEVRVGKVMLLK